MATWSIAGLAAIGLVGGSLCAIGQTMAGPTPSTMPLHGQAMSQDQSAAEGNGNQAIASTSADATTPARGANSFTSGEARRRIAAHGFTGLQGLAKTGDGIWRATAIKNGQPVKVWLDYKGSVGVE